MGRSFELYIFPFGAESEETFGVLFRDITPLLVDAAALAARIVIVEGGAVTQEGRVADVLALPATRFAAAIAGTNRLVGVAAGGAWALAADAAEGAGGADGTAMRLTASDPGSRAAGKMKKPSVPVGGGLGHSGGGGFKPLDFNKLTGAQRRSKKSKARDKGKKQHRRDR